MTDSETIQEGVMVYTQALHPVYQEALQGVIDEGGEDFTPEEALQIAMYRVGELAARAEKPERVLA